MKLLALTAMMLLQASSGGLGLVYAQDVYDTFTVNCQPLTVQRRDPLVSPGADLSDHVHSVVGGTAFSADLDPGKALASAATTCDKELDHSVYWVPQMYHITADDKYELVKFTGSVSCHPVEQASRRNRSGTTLSLTCPCNRHDITCVPSNS